MKVDSLFYILALSLSLAACGPHKPDQDLIGHWQASPTALTVRTEPSRMQFEFYRDTADFRVYIDDQFHISGNIGQAQIVSGETHCNWLLPTRMTGVAFILDLKLEGAIFDGDPLPEKEVQLWMGPDFDGAEWELRYTEGGAHFPMSFPIFEKQLEQ